MAQAHDLSLNDRERKLRGKRAVLAVLGTVGKDVS
jgi:hypothetical protein